MRLTNELKPLEAFEAPRRLLVSRFAWRMIGDTLPARQRRRAWTVVCLSIVIASLLLAQPLVMRSIFNATFGKEKGNISTALVLMLATNAALLGARTVRGRLSAKLGRRAVADLQLRLYERLIAMPTEFFTTLRSGALVSRVTDEVYAVEPLFGNVIAVLIEGIVVVVGSAVVLAIVDVRLALVLAVVVVGFPLLRRFESQITGRTIDGLSFNTAIANGAEAGLTSSGAVLARVSGQLDRERADFANRVEDVYRNSMSIRTSTNYAATTVEGMYTVVSILLFALAGFLAKDGQLHPGSLLLVFLYANLLRLPVAQISDVRHQATRALINLERHYDVLWSSLQQDLQSGGGQEAAMAARPSTSREAEPECRICFRGVRFTYRTADAVSLRGLSGPDLIAEARSERTSSRSRSAEVLSGIDLCVRAGQHVAVVGESGGGKSTLAYLAAGLYVPTSGSVAIDQQDTRSLGSDDPARNIALITQDTYLRHESIRHNLLFVAPHATEEQLRAACTSARLDRLIDALPNGLDTVVGERGTRLSGGERQRIAIARALLREPTALILDEPTSALDSENEAVVLAALKSAFEGVTSLTIAHRLSSVVDADTIFVLAGGRIIESGTHDELFRVSNGRYAALFERQRVTYAVSESA